MHPDRYGRPDTPAKAEADGGRWFSSDDAEDGPGDAPSPPRFLETFCGLAIFILAPIVGLGVTLLGYQWTRPDHVTAAWILGYAGVFVIATFVGAMLVDALRRILLALTLVALTAGIGYAAWHLSIA